MRNVFAMACVALGVTACGRASLPSGPATVQLIQPSGAGCAHVIAPATLQTLVDLSTLSGGIGRVATATRTLSRTQDLQDPTAFQPESASYQESGGVFYPANYESLYAASLYYAIERSYLTHKSLSPEMDAAKLVPSLGQTLILLDPTILESGTPIEDNAAYIPVYFTNSQTTPFNVFASFPVSTIQEMPLGLNTGVLGHEFTHLLFHHLFTVPERGSQVKSLEERAPRISARTMSSLDEGIADYFGFMVSKDPSFFLCSFPQEQRDLKQPRYFSDSFISRIHTSSNYDIHEGGAIFAAINYEIGTAIGYDNNARALHQLMRGLNGCVQPARSDVTFVDIIRCHVAAAGGAGAQVQEVYNRYIGSYSGVPQ